jgi:hypothetical protein
MMLSGRLVFFLAQNSPFFAQPDSTTTTGIPQSRGTTAKIINLLRSGNRSTFQLDGAAISPEKAASVRALENRR